MRARRSGPICAPLLRVNGQISARIGTRDLARQKSFELLKHKVPHAYLRADENARSLYGVRDDSC